MNRCSKDLKIGDRIIAFDVAGKEWFRGIIKNKRSETEFTLSRDKQGIHDNWIVVWNKDYCEWGTDMTKINGGLFYEEFPWKDLI